MIIADMGDGKVILLGLQKENIEHLKAGKPMRISAETHPGFPLKDTTILIVYGDTVEDLTGMLMPGISQQTVIVDHRKKKP